MNRMFDFFFKRPYLLYSLIAVFFVMGVIGLVVMPKNLFPDSDRPSIIVITQVPGAAPNIVATAVSRPLEQELSSLSLIRKVSSVNLAGMSVVTAEFEYEKGLEGAAVDATNAVNKARSVLAPDINPLIYTAGSFTLPVDVFALSPANDSLMPADIRKIAESDINPAILRAGNIGNVEIFGGHQAAITIQIDPLKSKALGVGLDKIAAAISGADRDIPVGFLKDDNRYYTLMVYGERSSVESLKQLPVAANVRLADVATVRWGSQPRFSAYIGNGKEAIAVAVQRAPGGSVLAASKAARKTVQELEKRYTNIHFEITETQRDLIDTANTNMLEALRDAIIFTLIVILMFLGNFRAVAAALASIPMVFFATIAITWIFGGELNIVIYTAIILALGMLVDDAVVVLENIERHLIELKEDLQTAIERGTREVILPVFAGTIATIVIMFPFLFVGDFPQKIYRPLVSTLIIALLVSFFLSITFIPVFSLFLYRNGSRKTAVEKWLERAYEKSFGRLVVPYVAILKFSAGRYSFFRKLFMTALIILLLVVSMKQIMPVIGRDLMPPMDTGIIKAHLKFSANESVETAVERIKPFTKWLHGLPETLSSSITFGSEPGVLSLGKGSLPTEAMMTINCVNRFERKETIWQIEEKIRTRLMTLNNVKVLDVYDFGATPLSSIKAPVDVRLLSEDYDRLPELASIVAQRLQNVRGLTSVNTSWDKDFTEIQLDVDENRCQLYGITPAQVAAQLPLKGFSPVIAGNLISVQAQPVRLYLMPPFDGSMESLSLIPIQTPKGPIPLSSLTAFHYGLTPAKVERDSMLYSIDINGYRYKTPITALQDDVQSALKPIDLSGVRVSQEGDIQQLNDSFSRMIRAIGVGVVLLLMTLVAIYHSVTLAVVMILVLPLAMIGASWGMLIFDKPSCMPSLMGILLLFGIIIKNSVLLIDFYQDFRKQAGPLESAIESVRVRLRPVFMTAFGTIAGMIPIAFEWAVGLERLSPLADVAIGGLLVGTLLTLIYIPMFAFSLDRSPVTAQIHDPNPAGR